MVFSFLRRTFSWSALSVMALFAGLLAACGGDGGAAPTATATSGNLTPAPSPAISTPRSSSSTQAQPTGSPGATLVPIATPVPQSAQLTLTVTSPYEDTIVNSDRITVAGLASPDATVSINGALVAPDEQGHFSLEVAMSQEENPMTIEVIATSVAGESQSIVRTVVFNP